LKTIIRVNQAEIIGMSLTLQSLSVVPGIGDLDNTDDGGGWIEVQIALRKLGKIHSERLS
jgi:hypothetical protein